MTPEAFNALFDSFTHSAYRLECLPSYAVPAEDATVRAFREGTPRPVRSVSTSPWMARIAVSTAKGKQWSRTRVVDDPPTEYQLISLPAYAESQAVGEQIEMVRRDRVGDIGPDFWLFDAETDHAHAVLMHYNADGTFNSYEATKKGPLLDELIARRAALHSIAEPLNRYLASAGRCSA